VGGAHRKRALSGYPDDMSVISIAALPTDPLDALKELAESERELDRLRFESVRAARARGASWDLIGAALGMTKQSAWEYFTRAARTALANQKPSIAPDEAMELAVSEVRSVRQANAE
jgi:hypothetical protein